MSSLAPFASLARDIAHVRRQPTDFSPVTRVPGFDTEPRVIVPKHPVIRFARIDLLDEANHARLAFEIGLAFCMALLGAHTQGVKRTMERRIGSERRGILRRMW